MHLLTEVAEWDVLKGFRLLFCCSIAIQLVFRFTHIIRFQIATSQDSSSEIPKIMRVISVPRFSSGSFKVALAALIITLVLSATAPLPAFFLLLSSILSLVVFSAVWELSYIHTKANLIPIILFMLALLPYHGLPLGQTPTWPLRLIQVLVAVVWFSSGLGKVKLSGFRWATGKPLRAYLLEHAAFGDLKGAQRLAGHEPICRYAAAATLVLELTFPLILIPKYAVFYLSAALTFHVFNFLVMRIDFFSFFCPAYLSFLIAFVPTGPGPSAVSVSDTVAFAGCGLIVLFHGFCAFGFRTFWPFQPFAYYSRWATPESVQVSRLALHNVDGSTSWIKAIDTYQPKWFYYGMMRRLWYNQPFESFVVGRALAADPNLRNGLDTILVMQISFSRNEDGSFQSKQELFHEIQRDPAPA